MKTTIHPLFNVLMISVAILAALFAVLTRLATATLPATAEPAPPAPPEVLRILEAVHEEDIRTKLLAREKELTQANVEKQNAEKTWSLYASQALAVGSGAIAGALAFNFINTGIILPSGVIPAAVNAAISGSSVVPVSSSIINSYAMFGAVLGGVIGNYLYLAIQNPQQQIDQTDIAN